ncbi:MAG: hypothetical protein WBD74_07710 [Candidatus Aquilonibacter sp.]
MIGFALIFFGLPLAIGAAAYFRKGKRRAFYSHPEGTDAPASISPETQAGLTGAPHK